MIALETGFYVTGGTLQRDTPSYVERQADTDLYAALCQGEFCYVLTSRQMGKSSLMVRTAARLREEGVAVANLELTALGQNLTAEQWYDGLLGTIGQELELEAEVEQFWLAHERLSPLQRWLRALREVVLARRPGRVVICLDEIDAVRSLRFSTDEFFAAIRECYNRRSEDPAFQRLTFCLLGVASPSDLIQDTRTTPFNIGRRIELNDFSDAEAAPLAAGLGRDEATGKKLLERVLYWTGGHPYLTQRLCQAAAEDSSPTSKRPDPGTGPALRAPARNPESEVDRLCQELFLSPGAREQDHNLLFVRERLLRSEADPAGVLTLYRQVRSGRRVQEGETNPLVSVLRLAGIARGAEGRLRVRNQIYARVFDRAWVAANMPDAELRRQRAAFRKGLLRSAAIAGAVVAVIGGLALSAARERDRVSRLLYVADMNVAQQALSEGNEERAEELLDEHRPGKGGPAASFVAARGDMRGFEWRYLWRLCQEGALHTFSGNGGAIWDVAYLPDGRTLAAVNRDGTVKLWNIATKELAADFPGLGHAIISGSLAFSPDGRTLAVGSGAPANCAVMLWDIATRRKVATLQSPGYRLAFSPDGRLLAGTGWNGLTWMRTGGQTAKLWDVTTKHEVASFQGRGQLWTAFSPDGRTMALARGGSRVELWDVAAKRSVALLRTPRDWAWVVAFSPDGKTLATYSLDQTVRLWDLPGPGPHRPTLRVGAPPSAPPAWRVVKTLKAPRSNEPLTPGSSTLTGSPSLVFSPNGRKLATAIGAPREVALWDLVRGKQIATLWGHKKAVLSIAFAPDSETLATASADGTVKLWRAAPAEGTEGTSLRKPRSEVLSVVFSPDGKTLAAGTDDGTVMLWSAASGRGLAALKGHRGSVRSVAFSPDGKLLASAGNDRTVRLWQVASQRQVAALTEHKDQVWCVAFSPNGKTLASGSEDGTVKLWDVAARGPGGPAKRVLTTLWSPHHQRWVGGKPPPWRPAQGW